MTLENPTLADRRKAFVLQEVQPGLLGLMDGSVSTLAPIFAAAGLTGRPLSAFFVGLAASLGAAISMGLSEALSDDGSVTGRGGPLRRGAITGVAGKSFDKAGDWATIFADDGLFHAAETGISRVSFAKPPGS
jgi:hypothetical protein